MIHDKIRVDEDEYKAATCSVCDKREACEKDYETMCRCAYTRLVSRLRGYFGAV